MPTSTSTLKTPRASRYLQQLCKHWAHKFAVTYTETEGHIPLPIGAADLFADADTLTVRATVPDGGDLAKLQAVIAEHLARFAFREGELVFDWKGD